jgi:OHCU decarboxylase
MTPPLTLAQLNAAPADEFVRQLAGIFEHSAWVAARAAPRRPFASRQQLLVAMCSVVDEAPAAEQLTLIRAHPQLATRGRSESALTHASAQEQRGAGLQACTPQDFARLDQLNAAYQARFAMPFIMAVRGHEPKSIIAAFEARLTNPPDVERATALREIGLIAGFRLADAVADDVSLDG